MRGALSPSIANRFLGFSLVWQVDPRASQLSRYAFGGSTSKGPSWPQFAPIDGAINRSSEGNCILEPKKHSTRGCLLNLSKPSGSLSFSSSSKTRHSRFVLHSSLSRILLRPPSSSGRARNHSRNINRRLLSISASLSASRRGSQRPQPTHRSPHYAFNHLGYGPFCSPHGIARICSNPARRFMQASWTDATLLHQCSTPSRDIASVTS